MSSPPSRLARYLLSCHQQLPRPPRLPPLHPHPDPCHQQLRPPHHRLLRLPQQPSLRLMLPPPLSPLRRRSKSPAHPHLTQLVAPLCQLRLLRLCPRRPPLRCPPSSAPLSRSPLSLPFPFRPSHPSPAHSLWRSSHGARPRLLPPSPPPQLRSSLHSSPPLRRLGPRRRPNLSRPLRAQRPQRRPLPPSRPRLLLPLSLPPPPRIRTARTRRVPLCRAGCSI